MSACTIVAANYVAMARILAASFEAHHPGVPFSTLIIDGDEADRDLEGLGTVVLPSDLSLPAQQWGEMASIYDVTELATAAKPALLEHVLDRHRTATYFDPDIKVYAPVLPELEGLAPIRLTPHCLEPVPRDGLVPTEHELMGAGLFNLGFISVTQAGRPFLRWWQDRLHHDALMDPSKHLFTDQRWIDWVPSLFEHSVLRDPGFNVAYWNAHERAVTPLGRRHRGRRRTSRCASSTSAASTSTPRGSCRVTRPDGRASTSWTRRSSRSSAPTTPTSSSAAATRSGAASPTGWPSSATASR